MNCLYCKAPCIRKGRRKDGTQKYRCLSCRRYQQDTYKNKAWLPATDTMIKRCVKRSGGVRDMAYIIGISATTVIRRIRKMASAIEKPAIPKNREYEADELKTYVQRKKNEQWVMYAIDRKTRRVIDFRVGKRNKSNLGSVINTLLLAGAKRICTDRLPVYRTLVPPGLMVITLTDLNQVIIIALDRGQDRGAVVLVFVLLPGNQTEVKVLG